MKCEKCGSSWVHWKNLGKIDAYLYCPDCKKGGGDTQTVPLNSDTVNFSREEPGILNIQTR